MVSKHFDYIQKQEICENLKQKKKMSLERDERGKNGEFDLDGEEMWTEIKLSTRYLDKSDILIMKMWYKIVQNFEISSTNKKDVPSLQVIKNYFMQQPAKSMFFFDNKKLESFSSIGNSMAFRGDTKTNLNIISRKPNNLNVNSIVDSLRHTSEICHTNSTEGSVLSTSNNAPKNGGTNRLYYQYNTDSKQEYKQELFYMNNTNQNHSNKNQQQSATNFMSGIKKSLQRNQKKRPNSRETPTSAKKGNINTNDADKKGIKIKF